MHWKGKEGERVSGFSTALPLRVLLAIRIRILSIVLLIIISTTIHSNWSLLSLSTTIN
jgi:hypothetical protein